MPAITENEFFVMWKIPHGEPEDALLNWLHENTETWEGDRDGICFGEEDCAFSGENACAVKIGGVWKYMSETAYNDKMMSGIRSLKNVQYN